MPKRKPNRRDRKAKAPGKSRVRGNRPGNAGGKRRHAKTTGNLLPPVSLKATPGKTPQPTAGKKTKRGGAAKFSDSSPPTAPAEKATPDYLCRIFSACGFEPSRLQLNLFWQYYLRIKARNQEINITRIHRFRDTVVKHFVDCALAGVLTKLPSPLMDLGSGGGFPGIPLKILHPEVEIILAEGRRLRVEFLEEVRKSLRLPKLYIHPHNIQPHHLEPEVKGVITRAVESIPRTLARVGGCLQTGGRVILMKGPKVDPEIREAGKIKAFKLVADHAYELPVLGHQRRLVVYQRV